MASGCSPRARRAKRQLAFELHPGAASPPLARPRASPPRARPQAASKQGCWRLRGGRLAGARRAQGAAPAAASARAPSAAAEAVADDCTAHLRHADRRPGRQRETDHRPAAGVDHWRSVDPSRCQGLVVPHLREVLFGQLLHARLRALQALPAQPLQVLLQSPDALPQLFMLRSRGVQAAELRLEGLRSAIHGQGEPCAHRARARATAADELQRGRERAPEAASPRASGRLMCGPLAAAGSARHAA
eukprot:CAMPEP_0176060882 /NCGR_PEP_ID=MMETSP0120_2-20121206/30350_1 /TAXON_ID=160619 /ORGANISM="Kryptoperidinium foliaceum, Strain CCMP 1326" /LENGTH=245 /DNA_ID=CAMNT_0017394433 /DNA_START=12 /DNA_END=746 /DNA_ORIENTATION=-